MKPVLRVIVPTSKLAVAVGVNDKLESSVPVETFTDYMTENLSPPADAVYAAQIDENGKITEVITKSGTYTPTVPHTFAGWPIP